MQLQRLEGFYWVARTGGYAKASRAFPYPISQPGVHQQVKRLEVDMDVRLFERLGKDRVGLTAAGRQLYEFVAPFLEGLPGLTAAIQQGRHGGRLRIHASALALRQMLPSWLRRLHESRPDIEIVLMEIKTADVSLLRTGETDLLLDHLPPQPPEFETRQVGKVAIFIVLPTSHPLARKRRLQLGDLRQGTFISYSADRAHRDLQMKALALHGVSPQHSLSADTSESILGFVAAGLGFSLVPSMLPNGPRVAGVVAHPLSRPATEFAVVAAWRRSSAPNPLIVAALEYAPSL